ncbi:class V chitinase CHIT5 [Capsicum galapagoense]
MAALEIWSTILVVVVVGSNFHMCCASRYVSVHASVSTSPLSGPMPPLNRPLVPGSFAPSAPASPIPPVMPPSLSTSSPPPPSVPTIPIPSVPPFPGASPPSAPSLPILPILSMPPFPSTSPSSPPLVPGLSIFPGSPGSPSSPLIPGLPIPSLPPFPSTSPSSPPLVPAVPSVPAFPGLPSSPSLPQIPGLPMPSMPPFPSTSPSSPPFIPIFPPFPATSSPSPPYGPIFPVPSMPPFPATSPPYMPSIPPPISPSAPPVPYSSPPSPSKPLVPFSTPPMMPQSPAPAPIPLSMPPVPASVPYPDTPIPSPRPTPTPSGIKAAYWPSWLAEKVPSESIPTAYFTHIFNAFAVPDNTSFQLLISQADKQSMINFTSTIHSHSPATKVMLSIGGDTGSPILPNMTSCQDNRFAFIKSTIDVARSFGFDGLDLDWEFPVESEHMLNLALLLKEWRLAINIESLSTSKPPLILSAAVYFSPDSLLSGTFYPGEALSNYLDFLSPMCYNYQGSWDTSATGAPALLYNKSSNISTSYGISSWKQNGIPSTKLVMGIPLYGNTWKLKDPSDHGIGSPAVGVGPGAQGEMSYDEIVTFNSENNATIVYNNETVSTYSYAGTNWIGYDDTNSIKAKIKYAKAQGLGGYFFWALGFDSNWTLSETASSAWDEDI